MYKEHGVNNVAPRFMKWLFFEDHRMARNTESAIIHGMNT